MYSPPPYRPPLSFPGAPDPEPPPRRRGGSGCIWGTVAALSVLLLLQVSGLVILFGMPDLRSQLFAPLLGPAAPLPHASTETATPGPSGTASPVGRASQGNQPPPESPNPMNEPAQSGLVFIEENFDAATMRWDQSLSQIVDGTYQMRVDTANYDSYGLIVINPSVADFAIAVDVQQMEGDRNAEYGIRFRQSSPNNYLMFSVSGSGYYRLVRVTDDVYESLVPWTFDERIKTAPRAVNRLHLVAQGSSLTASINDAEVIDATDEVNGAGQLTLGITTFDSGGVVVRFDNLAGEIEGEEVADDFSDADNSVMSLGGAQIREGGYDIFSGQGVSSWQQPLPDGSSEVADFVLDVDVSLVDFTSDDAAYGVMFGDGGAFDFYRLFLLPQGAVVMLRSDSSGNVETLIPPIPLDYINQGTDEVNHIRIEVRGNTISITLNGEQLPDVETIEPVRGMVGLIVSSGSGTVQARFDNFRLEELAQGDPM